MTTKNSGSKRIEYDEKADMLRDAFLNLPPDFDAIRKNLAEWRLPSEALSRVACDIAGNHCFCEYYFAQDPESSGPGYEGKLDEYGNIIDEKLVSYYFPEILKTLLDFGMSPNDIIDADENIMSKVNHIDYNDDIYGARCLKLLLEHGGDPNLLIDGETLFQNADFDIVYATIDPMDYTPLTSIPYWLVIMGYGGQYSNGRLSITMMDDNDPAIFRDFENYGWRAERVANPNDIGPPLVLPCFLVHPYLREGHRNRSCEAIASELARIIIKNQIFTA